MNIKTLSSLSEVLARGLNWLFFLILPSLLDSREIGQVATAWAIVMLVVPIISFGMQKAILRLSSESPINATKDLSPWLFYALVISPVTISLICTYWLDIFTVLQSILIGLFTTLHAHRILFMSSLLGSQNFYLYTKHQGLFSISKFIISILVFSLGYGFDGWLFINVAIYFVSICFMEVGMSIKLSPRMKELVAFGRPFYIASVLGILISTVDKTVLTVYQGFEISGVYSIAQSLTNIVSFSVAPLLVYFEPRIYGKDDSRPDQITFLVIGLAIGLTVLFGLRAMAPIFVERMYGVEYSQAVELIGLLASGLALNFIGVACLVFMAKNKERGRRIILLSAIPGIFAIVLNLILIPNYGDRGAALSVVMAYLLQAIYALHYMSKSFSKISMVSITAISTIVIASLWHNYVLLFAFPILLYLLYQLWRLEY